MSIQQEKFKEIADAIRAYTKENGLDPIKPNNFAEEIKYACLSNFDVGYIEGRNTMISRTLTSIDDIELKSLGNFAFAGMGITSVNLPNVSIIGKYSFRGCTGLTEIDLPKLTTIRGKGDNTFAYCEKVVRYNLPKLSNSTTDPNTGVLMNTFIGNYALERLDLLNHIVIGSNCFLSCRSLKTLVLGESAVLQDTNAFNGTPIKNGTGYIYVPDDMVETYKTATNWVLFASQIRGYDVIPYNFYVDGVEYITPHRAWKDFISSSPNEGRMFGYYSPSDGSGAKVDVNDVPLYSEEADAVSFWGNIIPNHHYYTVS